MRIHYLQHVPFEEPGYLGVWFERNSAKISITHLYNENHVLPNPDEIDTLIILGGPMNVNDDKLHTWLTKEKQFITDCIQANKKVIGICLGAQLVASCLGASVHRANHKEIGWYPVIPTEDCKKISWFHYLFKNNPTVFHWHGDQFDIPIGAINLLSSKANSNQAFLYKNTVLALQFHLEVGKDDIESMIIGCGSELKDGKFVQTSDKLLQANKYVHGCEELMDKLLDYFIKSIGNNP